MSINFTMHQRHLRIHIPKRILHASIELVAISAGLIFVSLVLHVVQTSPSEGGSISLTAFTERNSLIMRHFSGIHLSSSARLFPVFDARKRHAWYVSTKPRLAVVPRSRWIVIAYTYIHVCLYSCTYSQLCACVERGKSTEGNIYACKKGKRRPSFVLGWSNFGSLGQRICDLLSISILENARQSVFFPRSPFALYMERGSFE